MIEKVRVSVRSEDVRTSKLLTACGICKSVSESRRLIKAGAVFVDNVMAGSVCRIHDKSIVKVGRKFVRLNLPNIPKEWTIERSWADGFEQVKVLAIKDLPIQKEAIL